MFEQNAYQCIELLKHGVNYNNIKVTYRLGMKLLEHEVRVAVKACGVNLLDILVWQRIYERFNFTTPFIMGFECAGEVVEVGKTVKEFEKGDRVMCWNFHYGMWKENICIAYKNCYKIPNSMNYEEAAAFPISYITAYIAVIYHGNLRPGQILYIQTAAGGVGCAAIQIAKSVPNISIIGTASASKHEFLYKQGLGHCFESRKNARREIEQLYPKGVDIIMCNIIGKEMKKNKKLLKPLGRFIYFGAANLVTGTRLSIRRKLLLMWYAIGCSVKSLELVNEMRAECGINVSLIEEKDPKCIRQIVENLMVLHDKGYIKPVIDSVWSFSEVKQGISRLIDRKNVGKVILVPDTIKQIYY